jgi:hypothetical protein
MSIKLLKRATILAGIILLHFTVLTAQPAAQPTPAASPAQSINPEKRALIMRLIAVMEVRKTALAMYNSMLDEQERLVPEMVWQGIEADMRNLTAAEKDELKKKVFDDANRTRRRIRELFAQRVDLPGVIEEISIELYDKHFSDAEIRDLIAFYASPTGKKSVEVIPRMFAESMTSTAQRLTPIIGQLVAQLRKEEAERIMKELEKTRTSRPVKATPKRRSTRTRKSHH